MAGITVKQVIFKHRTKKNEISVERFIMIDLIMKDFKTVASKD